MDFEYDKKKSYLNKQKHGIDFIESQQLWLDENRIIVPAKSDDENRYVLIGKYRNKHWSAFYTIRNKSIRIISVRRSRIEERNIYED